MTDLRLGRWQDVLADDPADGSVRLILTSPPYDNARTYEGTNEMHTLVVGEALTGIAAYR